MAWYNKNCDVKYTKCNIRYDFTENGYSKIVLEINAGQKITDSQAPSYTRMTSTMFRDFFGFKDAKATRQQIEKYKGNWIGNSFMSIEFDNLSEVHEFIAEVITPKLIMAKIAHQKKD